MLTEHHLKALRELSTRLQDPEINWALTGSTSFALQGVPLTAHDIDVQTDRAGAYAIERLFAAQVVHPVRFKSSATIRSHFGALRLYGIDIELMGDIQKRLPGGAWEEIVDLRPLKRQVELDGMRIPVLDLIYEQQAYLMMGRIERAALLADFLHRKREQ